MDHPYAFKNGEYCCSTNEENPCGGSQSEIASGTCDGIGFDITSTCCKTYDDIKCPGDSCIENKDKTTTIMTTTTTYKQR